MNAGGPAGRSVAALAGHSRFLDATLSSIPDFVYAFDPQRRFAYANPATLGLFGLSADEVVGKTFSDLGYTAELAERLNGHLDRILQEGVTVEDEVFYRSPTGRAAYFAFLWGPVRGEDGSVELVVGVSRDTSERRAMEEALRTSEARLRAATELAGLGIYSWVRSPTPSTGTSGFGRCGGSRRMRRSTARCSRPESIPTTCPGSAAPSPGASTPRATGATPSSTGSSGATTQSPATSRPRGGPPSWTGAPSASSAPRSTSRSRAATRLRSARTKPCSAASQRTAAT